MIASTDTSYFSAINISIAVVAVVLILVAGYYLARFLKGRIEIQLQKTHFQSGEEICGNVAASFKKSVKLNRLYVALVGYQITEQRGSDGKNKTRKIEFYRNEINLLESQSITAGVGGVLEFCIVAPGNQTAAELNEELSDAQKKIASAVGAVVNTIGALSSTQRRTEWFVEARADLPGVDLATSTKVTVNLI